MPLFWKPYKSEVSSFIDDLKAKKPTLEAEQRAGRALLWDKQIDRDLQSEYQEAKVAQQPGPKIQPVAPGPGVIGRMIRAIGSRPEPEIPVKAGGNRRCFRWAAFARGPAPEPRRVPYLHFAHRTDLAVGEHLAHKPGAFGCLALVAALGGHFGPARRLGHLARFKDGIRERLFAINMLAPFQRRHGDDRMGVVRRGYHHGVHVFLLEQLAIIAVCLAGPIRAGALLFGIVRIHEPPGRLASALLRLPALRPVPRQIAASLAIDVADRDHLHLREPLELDHVLQPLPPNADAGQSELLARGDLACSAEHMAGHNHDGRCHARPNQEIAPRKARLIFAVRRSCRRTFSRLHGVLR